ncbi:ABC transporter permease [Bacillus pseudomycoides]|uniref:ABC transporter permease n=1 Tax=Bacillus pseudomycoides TaxID=64104 RepID=UPI000BEF5404|nr:ABC transporter permease [Bacillus pseudomycoides]MCR8860357.1 ABC transporter permease [Bacillus pseudomycoides]PEK70453.1 ABC transporter permease [Bacillus pseudomycoides]
MKKALKITLTGLFATTLLVGCGSKEEPKKESTKQEAKQESRKDTMYDEEKATIAENFHPAVYPHKQDGTIDKLAMKMTKKEKLELYDYVEKKAKAEGMTPEEYSKVKGEENDRKAREQTKAKQEQKAQETQPKTELTQDQCDTVKSENEMMKKSINQGNTNSTSANEYKKNQQKLELCKKQGMSE